MVAGGVELGTASVVGYPNGEGIEVVLEKRADFPKGRRFAALRHHHRILDHPCIERDQVDDDPRGTGVLGGPDHQLHLNRQDALDLGVVGLQQLAGTGLIEIGDDLPLGVVGDHSKRSGEGLLVRGGIDDDPRGFLDAGSHIPIGVSQGVDLFQEAGNTAFLDSWIQCILGYIVSNGELR